MIVLGLNCFHGDSSAALIRDGELVAAAEEERFRRVKHWAGFPSQAITFCLARGRHHAVRRRSRRDQSGQPCQSRRQAAYILAQRPDPRLVWSRWKNRRARVNVAELVRAERARRRIRWTGSRASSTISRTFPQPSMSRHLKRRSSVSVDGFGDFASAAWGVGRGHHDSGRWARLFSRIRSASSIRRSPSISDFPTTATSTRSWGLRPMAGPPSSEAMRQIVRLQPDGSLRARSALFPPSPGANCLSME